MSYARVMNASVMSMKQMEFVLAAKVSGAKKFRVIFRHLIPNAPTSLAARTSAGS